MACVLVVDDQSINRDLVVTLLQFAGHTALQAADGGAALDLVRQHHPDLVVCDLLMPVMDGYEFVRQLRLDPELDATKVMFYTATFLESEARALANACGVFDVLVKPCEPEVILQAIADALDQAPMALPIEDSTSFDREHLRLLTDKLARKVDEQEATNRKLRAEIAERQRATEQLRESESRFRQIAEHIREVFYLTDPLGLNVLYVNRAYEEVFGLSRESLYAEPRSWLQAVHPDERDSVAQATNVALHPDGYDLEYRIVRPDGAERSIRAKGVAIHDASGQLVRVAGTAQDVTEEARLRLDLRQREAALSRAQTLSHLAHVVTRADGSFESWSASLPALIGVAPADVPLHAREWLLWVHPDDRDPLRSVNLETGGAAAPTAVDYRMQRGDGQWIHLHQEIEPLPGRNANEPTQRWFSTLQDVTLQKAAEQRIRHLNRVYAMHSGINALIVRAGQRDQLFGESCRVAVEVGAYGLAWIGLLNDESRLGTAMAWCGDDGSYTQLIRFTNLAGTPWSARPASRALRDRQPVVSNDVAQDASLDSLRDAMLARGLRSQACLPLMVERQPVGVLTLCSTAVNAFDEQEVQLLMELADNISFALDYMQKGERLNYLAYYDALTGLPNVALMVERLEQEVVASGAEQRQLALVLLDIERFKGVNQAFGRLGGDALLKQLATRLLAATQVGFQVARIGADRFALTLRDVVDAAEVGRRLAELYPRWFEPPFVIEGQKLHASAKLGIAMSPVDGDDAETLYRNAESAVNKAKAATVRTVFFNQRMAEAVSERLAMEGKLRQALEHDEFVLYYQPKVDMDTRRLEGVEALIRWSSPEFGLVPPARFISLLEDTGLIVEVGLWVLRQAAQDHSLWRELGLPAPRIAVNISAKQLQQPDFVNQFIDGLAPHSAPQGVDIELTESLLMGDMDSNIEKLQALCASGMHLSIDDFGTGYSSLAYLSRLPAETLKIDRTFIMTMLEDPNHMTLVSTMISLAHSLRMKVVAEGVETEEQAKILRLLRCDQMQGFLIGQPLAFEPMSQVLQGLH